MSKNPLLRPTYDAREFYWFNMGVRKSIEEYDKTPKAYPPELLLYPSSEGDEPVKPCAVKGCGGLLTHLRSNLCPKCREERRAATKRVRKTPRPSQDPQ